MGLGLTGGPALALCGEKTRETFAVLADEATGLAECAAEGATGLGQACPEQELLDGSQREGEGSSPPFASRP